MRSWGTGKEEKTAEEQEEDFGGDRCVDSLDCGDFRHVKMCQIVFFEHVQLIVFQLYLNKAAKKSSPRTTWSFLHVLWGLPWPLALPQVGFIALSALGLQLNLAIFTLGINTMYVCLLIMSQAYWKQSLALGHPNKCSVNAEGKNSTWPDLTGKCRQMMGKEVMLQGLCWEYDKRTVGNRRNGREWVITEAISLYPTK